jgi:diguanylate cyclase (GGDEF)-like protein/PAS domain S-box-containing protein
MNNTVDLKLEETNPRMGHDLIKSNRRKDNRDEMKIDRYLLLAAITAGTIFTTDLAIPLGVAFGVPYIVVILITLQTPYRHAVIIAAVISSVLVLLGLVFSPEGGEAWKIYFNRAIAIVAIWIVALLVGLIKKEKEKLLQRSEAELKEAQRTAKLGIFRINFLDNSVWWSDDLYHVLGLQKDEVTPTYDMFFEYIHVDDVDRVREVIERLRQSESAEIINIEYRAVTRNDDELYIHAVFTPEKESTGKTVRCMSVCQDITDRKKTEETLRVKNKSIALMENIAAAANESNNTDETIKTCIDLVCSYKKWPIGHYYASANDGTGDLVSTDIWHVEHSERFETFLKVTEKSRCVSGIGLPGQVLSSGKPIWIVDVTKDANFPRAKLGEDIGVKAGLAFPIKIGEDISGVLEFFSEETAEPHLDELEIMAYIGNQLGRVIERKQAEEKLQKLSRAVENSSSAVYITDLYGNIEYINPKFTEITGYTWEETAGKNPAILQSIKTSDTIFADMWETITSGEEWKGEFYNRKKDGSLYRARNSISGIRNNEGEITHYVAIQEDVTHEHELSKQLKYQACYDSLTGLVNRREFESRAERLLSTIQHDKEVHALCFLDLDQFKVVNDTCGHAAGDEMLHQLSSALQKIVRSRDTLARLGGDEFGVLMEHCSLNDARRVAKSLQKVIQDYQFVWEGRSFRVGVSIGLVPITETTSNLTELLKNADAACYMAKEQGRNRIHVHHAEDAEMAQRHGEMQWVTRLNHALDEDRFCLYAQTIMPLDDRTDKHYELLIRMVDEKGEIIPPGAFLPAAERYNLISKIDHWVIENAFGLLADNPAFLKQINFIAINLSGQSLTDPIILKYIITQLDESEISGDHICFEITETAAISNLGKAIKFISSLRGMGCRFALDDFGSGLSSFGYLKNMPVDYLKIDGMFVKDIFDDPIDHAMVKSINEIGHVMGMETIAEFVENDVIKGMLKEIGVNYAQGYGIEKPQPFDELLRRPNNVIDINMTSPRYMHQY